MRAGATTLAIAIVTAAAAAVFELRPFEPFFHSWGFAVVAALAGLLLLAQGIAGLRTLDASEGFAALGALGGALVCASMVVAAFAVGRPHLLAGAPGQTTPVSSGASLAVQFPQVAAPSSAPIAGVPDSELGSSDSVMVLTRGQPRELHVGQTTKIGQYVLRVAQGPIARVIAATLDGKRVTITQPQGSAFASPYLLFPALAGEQRLDFFAVPPLHRTVDVTYFPHYRDESRGIDIETPFVLVQVSEQNGAPLYRGPAVSKRTIRGGGLALTFFLGQYPSVELASSPALLPMAIGVLMLAASLAGYGWAALRRSPAR